MDTFTLGTDLRTFSRRVKQPFKSFIKMLRNFYFYFAFQQDKDLNINNKVLKICLPS